MWELIVKPKKDHVKMKRLFKPDLWWACNDIIIEIQWMCSPLAYKLSNMLGNYFLNYIIFKS